MRYSAAKLQKKMDEVIDYCTASGEPPASHIVRRVTGLTEKDIAGYRTEGAGVSCNDAVKKLDDYRTYFWLKKALDDPRWASFAVFNLKQPQNGGYVDKIGSSTQPVQIQIKLSGVGEDAFM